MAAISFDEAKTMVNAGNDWLTNVSELINGTATKMPKDIYNTQKLAFLISKSDLQAVCEADKVMGILGYEPEKDTLTVILVGLNQDLQPSGNLLPRQTWPVVKKMTEIDDVLNGHLKP